MFQTTISYALWLRYKKIAHPIGSAIFTAPFHGATINQNNPFALREDPMRREKPFKIKIHVKRESGSKTKLAARCSWMVFLSQKASLFARQEKCLINIS
jgi:hypothetical protein